MAPTLLVPGSLRGHPGKVPVVVITEWLKKRMPEFGGSAPAALRDRVIIAKSETGSGKSTVLPVYVFRLLRDERTSHEKAYAGRSVLCTQPRVLTAMVLARDQAASPHYPDMSLPSLKTLTSGRTLMESGGTVGFQTGPITNKPTRGLIYSTAGVLLAQLNAAALSGDYSEIAGRYAFIIIDEAHEQSADIDTVLMLLKQMLLTGMRVGGETARQLPFVILASATIDVEVYARFFGLMDEKTHLPLPSNTFHVTGRQHGIETRWPSVGTNDYPADAAARAAQIHTQFADDPADQRDILIFMPGALEAQKVEQALVRMQKKGSLDGGGPVLILLINREVVNSEGAAFRLVKTPPAALWDVLAAGRVYEGGAGALKLEEMKAAGLTPRRIVVATVVAETGLTIETLKYVIDAGWNRSQETYQPLGARGLITRPAAQSRIKQRKGRAGRLFPGVFYPLYTENVYEALPKQQMPDIVTEGMDSVALNIVLSQQTFKELAATSQSEPTYTQFRIADMDMLNPPPVDALASSLSEMTALGFFSPNAELYVGPAIAEKSFGDKLTGLRQRKPVGHGYGLTAMGRIAAGFSRLDMNGRRLILAGPLWKCAVSDLATMAAVATQCGERGLAVLLSKSARRKIISASGGKKRDDQATKVVEELSKALLAGLPPYFAPKAKASQAAAQTGRDVLQDDILVGLAIFEGYKAAATTELRVGIKEQVFANLTTWCADRNLDPEAMLDLAQLRESILQECIVAGLNPYWGAKYRLAKCAAPDFPAQVQKLKRCLYDAYRTKLLTWSKTQSAYLNQYGFPVEVTSACVDIKPRPARLVTPAITITRCEHTPKRLLWMLASPTVSVLDTQHAETAVGADPGLIDVRP